jgi:hypothetical protein
MPRTGSSGRVERRFVIEAVSAFLAAEAAHIIHRFFAVPARALRRQLAPRLGGCSAGRGCIGTHGSTRQTLLYRFHIAPLPCSKSQKSSSKITSAKYGSHDNSQGR